MPNANRLVELTIENGLQSFHCPACGTALLVPDEGFKDRWCSHFRFFLDWVGEITFAETKSLAPAVRANQETLRKLWNEYEEKGEGEYLDDVIMRLTAALPTSALVVKIVEPARGGGHDGSTIFWGIDFNG